MAYVDVGTVSARGQIAIPQAIRRQMDIKDGEKVLMMLQDKTLVLKKVSDVSWAEVTAPLRKAKKKIKESEVDALIHAFRTHEKSSLTPTSSYPAPSGPVTRSEYWTRSTRKDSR